MRNFFDVGSDRRRAPRTKLAEIAYLGIGPENGGIVLDVSDGGLSFHAVSPVQPAESIRFLLSLKGQSRIEGAGEVVWTDDMKTVGGLRFTSLSAGAREHLDNWTNKTRIAAASELASASNAQTEAPDINADEWPANAETVFAIPPAEEQLSSNPDGRVVLQNPVFYWGLSGLLAVALSLASFLYGVHMGKSEIRRAAQSAPKAASQSSAPKIAPAPVPAPSIASSAPANPITVPPVPKAPLSVPSNTILSVSNTPDTSLRPIKSPGADVRMPSMPNQTAELGQEAGKSELAVAMAALNGDSGKRDSAKAVRLLWAAVSKGNASAAVILADLYVTGDGVAENCEQARLLLTAAASHGNAEAKVKLDELSANGCS